MTKENKIPQYIKNSADLKALTAGTLYDLIEAAQEQGQLDNNKVIFYTTIGTLEGNWIADEPPDENNFLEEITDGIINTRNSRLINLEDENENLEVVNASRSIYLTDVTLTPYNGVSHHLSFFILFSDQIVGMSFGEKTVKIKE